MEVSKKIVLIGHFGVGKTSLVRRYVDSAFSEDYLVTLGVQVKKKQIELDDNQVNLIIWDLEGNAKVENMRSSYMLGTDGFLYVFDLTRPITFNNLNENLEFIKKQYPKAPVKIVGNKADLFDGNDLDEFLTKNKLEQVITTSAKEGTNVATVFEELARELL
ncbi:Rab family GTPase [Gilvibacter sp.]|uniref:Rab family GTPase n=1 Tax=Gilvibacter sp. TaxID=2729997 RepID=UPI0025C56FF2|nr:Rab family GTPase [Gilvibacter sp.]NQX77073.1 GTP-binding protein [Gilvibacter sp.]